MSLGLCVCCATCLCRDGSDLSQTRKILTGLGIANPSDDDCRTVRRACEAVSTRAARLAAGVGEGEGEGRGGRGRLAPQDDILIPNVMQ